MPDIKGTAKYPASCLPPCIRGPQRQGYVCCCIEEHERFLPAGDSPWQNGDGPGAGAVQSSLATDVDVDVDAASPNRPLL